MNEAMKKTFEGAFLVDHETFVRKLNKKGVKMPESINYETCLKEVVYTHLFNVMVSAELLISQPGLDPRHREGFESAKKFYNEITHALRFKEQSTQIQEIHLPFSNDPLNVRNIGEHALNIAELEAKLNEVIKRLNEVASPKVQP